MNKEQMQKVANTLFQIDEEIFHCKCVLIDIYKPGAMSVEETIKYESILAWINNAGKLILNASMGMAAFGFGDERSSKQDNITICQNCGGWLKGGECENCSSPIRKHEFDTISTAKETFDV